MVPTSGAMPSMALARLVRTSASFAASPGVTAPFCTQRVPRPIPTPSTSASW